MRTKDFKKNFKKFFEENTPALLVISLTLAFLYFSIIKGNIDDYKTTEIDRAKVCSEISIKGSDAFKTVSEFWVGYDEHSDVNDIIDTLRFNSQDNNEGHKILGTVYIPGKHFWDTPSCILRTQDSSGDHAYDLMDIFGFSTFNSNPSLLDYTRKKLQDYRDMVEERKQKIEDDKKKNEEEVKKNNELIQKYKEVTDK